MPMPSSSLSSHRLWQLTVFSLAVAVLVVDVGYAVHQVMDMTGFIQPNGIPLGSDFLSFWSAGHLAAIGRPEAAYDNVALLAVHQQAIPATTDVAAWFYPPLFQMVMLPFGALPYLVALPLYLVLTLGAYLGVLWRFRPRLSTLLLAVAFQGTWLCLLSGQNGFLSAALLGGGLLVMTRFPLVAGLVWGCFSYKPQLALQLPVALLAGRRWRILLGGALGGAGLVLLSLAVLGVSVWEAFGATAGRPLALLKDGVLPISHMISPFSALWMSGVSPDAALLAQAGTALLSAVAVYQLWRTEASLNLKGAGLIWATLLTNPHVFQYELPLAGFGLLLLLCEAERTGWRKGERWLLLVVWVSPPLLPFVFYPSVFLGLLLWTLKRSSRFLSDRAPLVPRAESAHPGQLL